MMAKLDQELEALELMSRDELIGRWKTGYGCPPPTGARRDLLMYAAAWHIQVKRVGGLSGEGKRMLRREVERIRRERRADGSGADDPVQRAAGSLDDGITVSDGTHTSSGIVGSRGERRRLGPGARLLREWNGRTHVVDVTESGYLYGGTIYRSLSAIARQITGAHWSGPRFFGL